MKQTEVRDKIQAMSKDLYAISDEVMKGLEADGLDNTYLSGKLSEVINVAKHIQAQLKDRK